MKKYAYLIMAHDKFDMLKKLIRQLDCEWNDIYIHVDIKAGEIDEEEYRKCASKSNIFFVRRISVAWGGYSQIQCEMILFEAALSRHYEYYHLLSGADYPIKSQKEIRAFFEENNGKEFVDYWNRPEKNYLYRVKYYYPLQEKIGRYTYDLHTLLLRIMSKLYVIKQKVKKVNRLNMYEGEFKIGSQWISITDQFVSYLIENKKKIEQIFGEGIAVDELFIQTMCWNSKFKNALYEKTSIRMIDWNRGKPYTWQEEDLDEILQSECLFIRKVSDQNNLTQLLEKKLNR